MNLPNLLTLLRIALIPVLVLLIMLPGAWTYEASAAVFLLASLTDWLDGYLARRLKLQTALGAFLDPVADKLIVVTVLVMLTGRYGDLWFALAAAVIVGREIMISAPREWMAEMQRRGVVAVAWLGKAKTTAQMIAILVLLYTPETATGWQPMLGLALLLLAATLTLASMVSYLRAARPTLREAFEAASSAALDPSEKAGNSSALRYHLAP